MEYLLHASGAVQCVDDTLDYEDVVDLLSTTNGVGYYWHTSEFNWSSFMLVKGKAEVKHFIADVPDLIKMAVMLT